MAAAAGNQKNGRNWVIHACVDQENACEHTLSDANFDNERPLKSLFLFVCWRIQFGFPDPEKADKTSERLLLIWNLKWEGLQ